MSEEILENILNLFFENIDKNKSTTVSFNEKLIDSFISVLKNELQNEKDEVLSSFDLFKSIQNSEKTLKNQINRFVEQFILDVIKKLVSQESTKSFQKKNFVNVLQGIENIRNEASVQQEPQQEQSIPFKSIISIDKNISTTDPIIIERIATNLILVKNEPGFVPTEENLNTIFNDGAKKLIKVTTPPLRVQFDGKIISGQNNILQFELNEKRLLQIKNITATQKDLDPSAINIENTFELQSGQNVFKRIESVNIEIKEELEETRFNKMQSIKPYEQRSFSQVQNVQPNYLSVKPQVASTMSHQKTSDMSSEIQLNPLSIESEFESKGLSLAEELKQINLNADFSDIINIEEDSILFDSVKELKPKQLNVNNIDNKLIESESDIVQSSKILEQSPVGNNVENVNLLDIIHSNKSHKFQTVEVNDYNVNQGILSEESIKNISLENDNEQIRKIVINSVDRLYRNLQSELDTIRDNLISIETLYNKFESLIDKENDFTEFIIVFEELLNIDVDSLTIEKTNSKIQDFIPKQQELLEIVKNNNIKPLLEKKIKQQSLELDEFKIGIIDVLDTIKVFFENKSIIQKIEQKYSQSYFSGLKNVNNDAKNLFYTYVEFEDFKSFEPVALVKSKLDKYRIGLLQLKKLFEQDENDVLKNIKINDLNNKFAILENSLEMMDNIIDVNVEISDYNLLSSEQNIGFLPVNGKKTMFIVLPKNGKRAKFYVRNENESPKRFLIDNKEVTFTNIKFDSGIEKTVALLQLEKFEKLNNSFIIMVVEEIDSPNIVDDQSNITEASLFIGMANRKEIYRIKRLDIVPSFDDISINVNNTNPSISKLSFKIETQVDTNLQMNDTQSVQSSSTGLDIPFQVEAGSSRLDKNINFQDLYLFYRIFDSKQQTEPLYTNVEEISLENYFPRTESQNQSWKRVDKQELTFLNTDLENKDFWIMYIRRSKQIDNQSGEIEQKSIVVRPQIKLKQIKFDFKNNNINIESSISTSSIGGYIYNSIGSFAKFEFSSAVDDDSVDSSDTDYNPLLTY